MSAGYRQQPGNSSSKRKDGKRVAGKQVFPPPGSGGFKTGDEGKGPELHS